MIILIHGDDIAKSRDYFILKKSHVHLPISFDGETVTLMDLTQAIEGGNLFGNESMIFIENFLTRRRKSREKDTILQYLLSRKDTTLYLWEEKEIDKRTAAQFQKVEVFFIPKSLFSFLEALKPNNGQRLIAIFHETLQNNEPEMIFLMLVRQIRLLLGISSKQATIEELKRLAPWQKEKLGRQAKAISQKRLLSLHEKLFLIDHRQKTGNLPSSLITTIDFFLLEL